MIFTVGIDEPPPPEPPCFPLPLLEQAASEPAATAPMAATVIARLIIWEFLSIDELACVLAISKTGGLGMAGRAPGENPLLEQRDEVLRAERDDRHDRHAGEDGVGIEVALGLAD